MLGLKLIFDFTISSALWAHNLLQQLFLPFNHCLQRMLRNLYSNQSQVHVISTQYPLHILRSAQMSYQKMSWKLVLVIPIINKFGLEVILPNYRPVSHMHVNLLCQNQWSGLESHRKTLTFSLTVSCPVSAYYEGHSTESTLPEVHANTLYNSERQKVAILVPIASCRPLIPLIKNLELQAQH